MSSSRGSEKGNLADNILQIVKFWKQLILLIEGTWVASAREGDDSSSSLTTAFKTHHWFIIMSILFRPRLSEKAASLWIPNIHNMFRPLPWSHGIWFCSDNHSLSSSSSLTFSWPAITFYESSSCRTSTIACPWKWKPPVSTLESLSPDQRSLNYGFVIVILLEHTNHSFLCIVQRKL